MGLINSVECISLKKVAEDNVYFFNLPDGNGKGLFSEHTEFLEMPPETVDEGLFCHHFQTDQLFVARGSVVLVYLQNRQYHYVALRDCIPQVVKIPIGIPHLLVNLSSEPCWIINALIRHDGVARSQDYQSRKKPFPLDMEQVEKLISRKQ